MKNGIRTIDVKALIDAERFSLCQWLILVLCFCIVTADGYDTAAIGFIAPSLTHAWGIDKSELGVVMSAALVGLGLGSVLAGPIADRLGRKTVLIASVASFGIWSLIAASSHTVGSLTVFRFLTGLGLGAAMPNTVALMSEYAPQRLRSIAVNVMYCGFSVGLIAGGTASAWMIPHFGWQSVLVVGGVLPIMLSVVLIAFLPESVQFLVVRSGTRERIARIIVRIAPHACLDDCSFVAPRATPAQGSRRFALALILSSAYRVRTIMLWIAYFASLIVYYLMANWMPTLFRDLGFSTEHAMLTASLFPLGGLIGNPVTGWLMDRVNANRTIVVCYLLVAVLVALVGHSVGNATTLSVLIFLCGALATSASTSLSSYAAHIYPTEGRSTGVAWMQGIGRLGGVAGSFAGAAMLGLGWQFGDVFTMLAIPALISALAIFVIGSRKSTSLALHA